MLDLALREPLQDGLNIIKVTANDASFATVALVEVEKVDKDVFCCKDITLVSTVGYIHNRNFVDNAILDYLQKQMIS